MAVRLQDVFGVTPREQQHSYVDRGGLDARLSYAVSTQRLVIIHGDSKQGKTWLRQRVLDVDDCVPVQCQIGATPASILTQALGRLGVRAELTQTSKNDLSGSMDVSAAGELGVKLMAKLKLQTKVKGGASHSTQRQSAPVGQTPADLAWVADVLNESGKRLVIEDFHYLGEESRRQFAFLLKGLGDYGVHPVIIGVWSQDHMLTYYNGDLSERVEDIHLLWEPDELDAVLTRGGKALNLTMSPSLRQELILDAYGNVGTLQALAEALCQEEGIYEHLAQSRYLTPGPALERSRERIASGMQPRFQGFADAYVAGLRELPAPQRHVLHAAIAVICDRPDDELLHGVSLDHLTSARDEAGLAHGELVAALSNVERFQSQLDISPLVMTFNSHAQSLCLIDRRFLFFRKYGTPRWPWHEPDFIA
jgi:hypothetical protein